MSHCPLCSAKDVRLLWCRNDIAARHREFWECGHCGLVFVPEKFHLTSAEEMAHYRTHQNDPSDPRYLEFLNRLTLPLKAHLSPGASGLDYGAGPGPAMHRIFREWGHSVANYDLYYAPDAVLLNRKYDFITCSECAEHFRRPREEFERIFGLLQPGGILALMTGILEDDVNFERWWYPKDPTHIAFYRPRTIEWIAGWKNAKTEFPAANVALLRLRQG